MENGIWSRWRKGLTRILLAVTVSMTTGEFIEMQKLSHEALRARFKLDPNCDPSVTALNTDPVANRLTVAIECRVRAPLAPAPNRPAPRPAGKGS